VPGPSPTANLRYLTSLDRLGICASSARARGNTGWLVTRRSTLELFTYTMSAKNSHLSFISHSQITFTLLAQVAASIVAVSPKFGLMPTSSFPLEALTPFITTWRSALCLQLPQERYSFPIDGYCSGAVLLDDFVLGTSCAAAGDRCVAVALEGQSVCSYVNIKLSSIMEYVSRTLAHCRPPHVCDCAGAFAVNSFYLVLANDDVAETTAILHDKNCV
jgi:hypothetical protein